MKLEKLLSLCSPKIYDHDLLITAHNHDFMDDPKFKKAYQKGVEADKEYYWYWRVHVGIWAASTALQVEGDFVECGVNKGFLSTSIMTYLDWNTLNRNFFLFDTFNGLNETLLSDEEKLSGRMEYSKQQFSECYQTAKDNFKAFKNTTLVQGSIPESLADVQVKSIAYLSIDMNCYAPELAAANHFWESISKGGIILLDDYAYYGFEEQKKAFDDFAARKNRLVLSLPTGQGIIIK